MTYTKRGRGTEAVQTKTTGTGDCTIVANIAGCLLGLGLVDTTGWLGYRHIPRRERNAKGEDEVRAEKEEG